MKTKISSGEVINITAPVGGTTSGVGVKIGSLLVIPVTTNAAGDTVAAHCLGEFDHPAEGAASGQAWALGDPVYWDNANKRLTRTATDNTLAGVATSAKASTATTGRFLLTPGLGAPGGAIADLALTPVTGVDGAGSNAASKADVDARLTAINAKVNAIIAALEASGIIAP